MRRTPTAAQIAEVERMAQKASAADAASLDNWRMYYLYNNVVGLYANRRDNPFRVSRRAWIEANVTLKDKRRNVRVIKLNQSQRNKEAIILRAERAKLPVRVVTLKVRQNGDSTQTLAIAFELMLRNRDVKVRLIADKEQLTEELLQRATLMIRELTGPGGECWKLQLNASNRDRIIIGAPIYSQIYVISARVPDPGHGETPDMLCMEETSRWPDAERKAKGVELGLPEVAGSSAFDTSTAHGNAGHYHDKFMRAWDRSQGLATAADQELLGAGGWQPHFVPWYLHGEEYRWSWIHGRPLPEKLASEIQRTLDDEEKILLKTRYYERRRGWCTVDLDQLAWRRYYISEKCNGAIDTFHEQCPAFVHEAFLASGRPAFDATLVQSIRAEYMRDPKWIGEIREGSEKRPYELVPNQKGPLWIWEDPKPGHLYAMGVDTSAGSLKGDPQVFSVIELESCRQVAEFRGWPSPEDFGGIVTRTSWLYNLADVGIETHPSPHGLRVYDAADTYGCKTLYSQEVFDSMEGKWVMKKGWYSSERNKIVLIGRLATALRDGIEIRSSRLLDEMRDAQLDDNEKIDRKSKNDLIVAHGIALKIRETAYREGRAPEADAPRLDFEERFWKNREPEKPRSDAGHDGAWASGEDQLDALYSGY